MVPPSRLSCKPQAHAGPRSGGAPAEPAPSRHRWILAARYRAWQAGGFIVLNVLDDPAWLALMFC